MSGELDDLTAFVRARYDEDEADIGPLLSTTYYCEEQNGVHLDRTTALREIAAKRGRLAMMLEANAEMDRLLADENAGRVDQAMAIGRARAAIVAVKWDALVYLDHRDYHPKWAPPVAAAEKVA